MKNDNFEFEILPGSWSKRRPLDTDNIKLTHFEVFDFKQEDGHCCSMEASFSDGQTQILTARVYANKTYTLVDGQLTQAIHSWGLQGTNSKGISVVLRLKE